MASFKKLMSDYGLGVIIILLLVAFGISTFSDYLTSKMTGVNHDSEGMWGGDDSEGPVEGMPEDDAQSMQMPEEDGMTGSTVEGMANLGSEHSAPDSKPSDFLPSGSSTDTPVGAPTITGAAGSNLLSAGHHLGLPGSDAPIRNGNLSLRPDPPIPSVDTGPFNKSTIEATSHKGTGLCL
tara:strand:- start:9563 stop:10102 length:540 start_codon:yes stop_codon:yes gene_type:complete